ncbi:MAG: 2-oxo acid dehydrogenase subunit E2 [Treponema sp.]|jgi:pyruvate dehydrogenase E2 component (dihydrolipoamide acetyltransferase)|nr:2-oxo acid dehydrogenase subunit E2 [Treponema sp.]
MAHILIMPRQGNTVESCIIDEWKAREGDSVTADTPVCVVETDKATFEVPAGSAGCVLKIIHPAGDDVPVLEPIAVIGAAGEDWQAALGKGEGEAPPPAPPRNEGDAPVAPPPEGKPPVLHGITASPRAKNLAEKEAVSLERMAGTGPNGRIIERDVRAVIESGPGLTAAVKAAGAGATVPAEGSGIGGRVTTMDVASPQTPPSVSPFPDEGAITDTPIKGIRKIIAARMFRSLAESAQFTLNASAPAARLQELRARMKLAPEDLGLGKVTINDLILFAVSRILPRFPFMNAHKIGDTLRTFERVHLGVAVDTPRGLMVPVIRNADRLSLTRISSEAKRLAAACQNGSAKPEELSGSTFTVTNLGSFGITSFTPVLNAPEVAILGVCGIELKPAALPVGEEADGCCGARFEPAIGFSLTINHQVVDGAPAARFLKALGEAVADIDLLPAAS